MAFGPGGSMSELHANASARRARERHELRGQRRTFMYDMLNAAFLVRRLTRRLRRVLRR